MKSLINRKKRAYSQPFGSLVGGLPRPDRSVPFPRAELLITEQRRRGWGISLRDVTAEQPYPLAAAIRGYRNRALLSQEDLAEKARVSVRTVRNIESGRVVPQVTSLRRLAQALGLDAAEQAALAAHRSVALAVVPE